MLLDNAGQCRQAQSSPGKVEALRCRFRMVSPCHAKPCKPLTRSADFGYSSPGSLLQLQRSPPRSAVPSFRLAQMHVRYDESLIPAAKHCQGDCRFGESNCGTSTSLSRGLSVGWAGLLPVTLQVYGRDVCQGLLHLGFAWSAWTPVQGPGVVMQALVGRRVPTIMYMYTSVADTCKLRSAASTSKGLSRDRLYGQQQLHLCGILEADFMYMTRVLVCFCDLVIVVHDSAFFRVCYSFSWHC